MRSLSEGGPVLPSLKGQKSLILLDYPALEDCQDNLVLSGLSSRASAILKLLSAVKIPTEKVSIATTIRCLTRSKAALTFSDYRHCGQHVLELIDMENIEAIMCFGSMAARVVLGKGNDTIDSLRGKSYNLNGGNRVAVVTYALSLLTDQGCSGCGRSVYPHLVAKDLARFRHEMDKRGLL